MWPKALIELLPHLTRLVPVVNRYFQSRADSDDSARLALERKLEEVAAGLRKDIREASASLPTADLSRQLTQQGKALAEIAAATQALQSQSQSFAARLGALEKRTGRLAALVALTLVFAVAICILLVLVLVKLHR